MFGGQSQLGSLNVISDGGVKHVWRIEENRVLLGKYSFQHGLTEKTVSEIINLEVGNKKQKNN